MKRHLFNLAAAVSLLLCLAALTLWVFRWYNQQPDYLTPPRYFRFYEFPEVVAVALTAILPLTWLMNRIEDAKLQHQGMCPTCNYDLRASPDRCPECGTKVKPQPAEGEAG